VLGTPGYVTSFDGGVGLVGGLVYSTTQFPALQIQAEFSGFKEILQLLPDELIFWRIEFVKH
jgi:hypothetical protein